MSLVFQLRGGGASLVVDARGDGVPVVLHWGADLGELTESDLTQLAEALVPAVPPSSIDIPQRLSLLPLPSQGWTGRPGLEARRLEREAADARAMRWPKLSLVDAQLLKHGNPRGGGLQLTMEDAAAGIVIGSELLLDRHGVLSLRHTCTNVAGSPLEVTSLSVIMPLSTEATELLDFGGRWPRERRPQRQAVSEGIWSRENRTGRTGHDSAFVTAAGSASFGFREGRVWATHVEWSGNQEVWVESRLSGHRLIGAGELLGSGEIVLGSGESYATPWVSTVFSAEGLDGISSTWQATVRDRRAAAGRSLGPRPVVLNTWEAVYFDHNLNTLTRLADAAAEVGVERFVLDDGWFLGRRNDRAGLGDWVVDPAVWPQGLHPLIEHVTGAGMEFGLWVEPEMVNLDSELAREHPEWILGGQGIPIPWRFQHVLDLSRPDAYAHVRDALVALLNEYPISYLKWDHNRDLIEGDVHAQTLAVYRMMDELRDLFGQLEIESCASGGARVDLGILERTDRVWASDTNDALERQSIQRWTGLLLPPELVGSHLGGPSAHTTGRSHRLSFRMITALFAHAGIEWDLTKTSKEERALIAEWIAVYKRFRGLLHSGVTVRADDSTSAGAADDLWVHGVLNGDGSEGLFAAVAMSAAPSAERRPLRIPGLISDAMYRVERIAIGGEPMIVGDVVPPWWAHGQVSLRGSVLGMVGLPLPPLVPEEACLVRVVKE